MAKENEMAHAAAERPAGAAAEEEDVDDEDSGSWGNLFVNMYYALVNLGIMLGALALIMVAYWLLKWATVSVRSPTEAYRRAAFCCALCRAARTLRSQAACRLLHSPPKRRCLCRITASWPDRPTVSRGAVGPL